jgi:uncharacterized small protein (DUF1192 family)
MMEEEPRPRPRQGVFEPAKFDGWSVDDLTAYAAALRAEAARAEAEVTKRGAQRAVADAFFRPAAPAKEGGDAV